VEKCFVVVEVEESFVAVEEKSLAAAEEKRVAVVDFEKNFVEAEVKTAAVVEEETVDAVVTVEKIVGFVES